MMEFLKRIISQLESATSDPVVKLLIISVSVLFIVIAFSVIVTMLKQFFRTIFKRNNKKRSIDAANGLKQAEKEESLAHTEQPTNQYIMDTHLQNAQSLLEALKGVQEFSELELAPPTLPDPITTIDSKISYTIEMIENLKYNPTKEDNERILESIVGKSVAELEQLLINTDASIKSTEITINADKKEYQNCVELHESLVVSQKNAVDMFNQGILIASQKLEEYNITRDEYLSRLKFTEDELLNLVESANRLIASLQEVKSVLIEKTDNAKQDVEDFRNINADLELAVKKAFDILPTYKVQAEKGINCLNENDKTISSLIDKITKDHQDLELNKLTCNVVNLAIERIKEEEAQKLAEQRAKEEAEAKAKAEQEARRREEQLAAERAEQLRIQEEKRLADEMAQKEAVARNSEKIISDTSSQTQFNGKSDATDDSTHVLTPAEEAEQARQMLEAQRERRRKAAQEKARLQSKTVVESSVLSESTSDSTEIDELDEQSQSSTNSSANSGTSDSENNHMSSPVDEMAKIRAGWAKEAEAKAKFEAYKKARDEEIKRRRAELQAKGDLPVQGSADVNE